LCRQFNFHRRLHRFQCSSCQSYGSNEFWTLRAHRPTARWPNSSNLFPASEFRRESIRVWVRTWALLLIYL
jgi:hypothetical protein